MHFCMLLLGMEYHPILLASSNIILYHHVPSSSFSHIHLGPHFSSVLVLSLFIPFCCFVLVLVLVLVFVVLALVFVVVVVLVLFVFSFSDVVVCSWGCCRSCNCPCHSRSCETSRDLWWVGIGTKFHSPFVVSF